MTTAETLAASDIAERLNGAERGNLAAHEAVIEAGREVFAHVGTALLAIRDQRLYRETHATFEDYLAARWGFTRQRAHQLIEAASVARNLSTMVDTPHLNERQARVLASLEPDEQRIVCEIARGTAPDGRVTSAHLKSLISVIADIATVGAIDDGSGTMVPWTELPPDKKLSLIQVNVTEELFERHAREREANRRVISSHGSVERYTPTRIVEAARVVLGSIDIDPASCAQANETVRAARVLHDGRRRAHRRVAGHGVSQPAVWWSTAAICHSLARSVRGRHYHRRHHRVVRRDPDGAAVLVRTSLGLADLLRGPR